MKRSPMTRKPHPDGRGNSSLAPRTNSAPASSKSASPRGKGRGKPTPQQVRQRRDDEEHRAMSKQVRREHPVCQVRRPFRCGGQSTDGHHILSRARGGPNERWNYLATCHLCHMLLHRNPKLAQEAGWLAKVGASCPIPREAA